MTWLYNGKEISDEQCEGYKAYVYIITNLTSGRAYIGKKRFLFTSHKRSRKRKNRIKVVRASDWREYYGSSKELLADIERLGKENFQREIIMLCKSLAEASYYEIKFQINREVLFYPDRYYNAYLGCRISRNQLGIK